MRVSVELCNGIDDDSNGFIDDVTGWDFYDNDNSTNDSANHGSHCSGTIGAVANNGVGVSGVNWECAIMACKFLEGSGSIDDGIAAIITFVAIIAVYVWRMDKLDAEFGVEEYEQEVHHS